MAKIQEFNIARLRTEEDFGFQKRIEAETALLTLETDKPMIDAYIAALTAFDDALKGSSRNSQSAATTEADHQAEAAWSGLNAQTKAMLNYPVAAARTAAQAAQESLRITGIVKQTRTDADDAYRALIERVNALALLNGEAPYATFIDHVNVLIDQAKATLAARETRAEKKKMPGCKTLYRNIHPILTNWVVFDDICLFYTPSAG